MVETELLGHAPGVVHIGDRTAPAVGGPTPELESGADDVVPGLGEEGGGDRGVDPARHGDQDAHGQARNRSTTLGMTASTWSISSSVVV